MNIFTPRLHDETDERIQMDLNQEDQAKIRRGTWKAEVTDQITGKRYLVAGAACSLPRCFCDAVILAELMCQGVQENKARLSQAAITK